MKINLNNIRINEVTLTIHVSHEVFEQLTASEHAREIFDELASIFHIDDISKFSIVDTSDDCESSENAQ